MGAAIISLLINFGYFFAGFITAQAPYEWGGRMHPMWTWGWGVVMMAMVFLVSGLVLFAGFTGIRWFVNQTKPPRPTESALEILRKRFARGEITKEEFETKKKELEK